MMLGRASLWICLGALLAAGKGLDKESQTGYFWQLNDLHYDHTYWTSQESCFEHQPEPGPFGSRDCDAPWQLVESAVKALRTLGPDPDFIVWLGDAPAHFVNRSNLRGEAILTSIYNISELIRDTFPNVPVFPLPGNHDYYPKNALESGRSDFYDRMAESWQLWFDDNLTEKFLSGGFYSKTISENPPIKGIVPNTNLIYKGNPLYKDNTDPGEQFQWMKSELEMATATGEKVFIFLHVPPGFMEYAPGSAFMHNRHNDDFLDILETYAHIILGVFAGHTHKDSFRIVDQDGDPRSSLFIAPSVTPWQWRGSDGFRGFPHNPAVRRFNFHRDTFNLINYEQFYLNLTTANSDGKDEWKLLYSFKDLYELQDISPISLKASLQKLKSEDNHDFLNYLTMNTVKGSDGATPCDPTCKCGHLCAIEFMHKTPYDACLDEPHCKSRAANTRRTLWLVLPVMFFLYDRCLIKNDTKTHMFEYQE